MADTNIQESIRFQQPCWSCKVINNLTNPNMVFGLLDEGAAQAYYNCLFCEEKNLVDMTLIVALVGESIRLDESVKEVYGLVEGEGQGCPHCGQPYPVGHQ